MFKAIASLVGNSYNAVAKAVSTEVKEVKEVFDIKESKKPAVKKVTMAKKIQKLARKVDGGQLKEAAMELAESQRNLKDAENVYNASKEEADYAIRLMQEAKAKLEKAQSTLKSSKQYLADVEEGTAIRRSIAGGLNKVADFIK